MEGLGSRSLGFAVWGLVPCIPCSIPGLCVGLKLIAPEPATTLKLITLTLDPKTAAPNPKS